MERENIGGMTVLSIKEALKMVFCMVMEYGVPKITIATKENTDKTRNTAKVYTSGVMA